MTPSDQTPERQLLRDIQAHRQMCQQPSFDASENKRRLANADSLNARIDALLASAPTNEQQVALATLLTDEGEAYEGPELASAPQEQVAQDQVAEVALDRGISWLNGSLPPGTKLYAAAPAAPVKEREAWAVFDPSGEIDAYSTNESEADSIDSFMQGRPYRWRDYQRDGYTCRPVSIREKP